MHMLLKLTAAAAALTGLAACDGAGGGGNKNDSGNASNAAAENSATADANGAAPAGGKDPAAAATPAAGSGELSRQFLVGRWTDNNDCNNTVEFLDDGTFTAAGGASGIWALDGDRLTFQGGRGAVSARVQVINPNTITMLQDDGTLGRSTRCTN